MQVEPFKPDDILFFHHIPKTAGTSITHWLSSLFTFEQICPHFALADVQKEAARLMPSYRLYAGHLGLGLLPLLPRRPRVITWLREPARRLLSSYHYLRELDQETLRQMSDSFSRRQQEAASRLSFDEWLRLPQADYAQHDLEAYSLGDLDCPDEDILPSALKNLQELDHVGLVERMQDSIDLLCYRLVWLPVTMDQRLNRSGASTMAVLKPDTLNYIREAGARAYEIHQLATRLFEKRWRAMLEDLQIDSGGAPELVHERLVQRFRKIRAATTVPRDGEFSLVKPIDGYGWMPPRTIERIGFGSLQARWSGPATESTVFLNLKKSAPLEISFIVLQAMDIEVHQSLTLHINGVQIPLSYAEYPMLGFNYSFKYFGIIPTQVLEAEPGLPRLVFRIGRAYPEPVASIPGTPPQLLGFCIDQIFTKTIQPVGRNE